MTQFQKPVPGTFRIVSILAVIWMLFGCLSYLGHVTMSAETIASLPPGQAEMMRTTPAWVYGLFAIATWSGLAGAVLLFFKRRIAVPLLLLSLVAAVAQFASIYLLYDALRLTGTAGVIFPVLIIALGFFFWTYARSAAANGWLK